jgi:hypothetical protein
MNIQDIRKQYPQYDDISDEQLLEGIRKKHYSDLDKDVFYSKINRVTPETPVSEDTPATPETSEDQELRTEDPFKKEMELLSSITDKAKTSDPTLKLTLENHGQQAVKSFQRLVNNF